MLAHENEHAFTFALTISVCVRVRVCVSIYIVFLILLSLTTIYASPWVDNYYSLHPMLPKRRTKTKTIARLCAKPQWT